MKNYNESVEINRNLNRPYIPDNPYRILITGGSRSAFIDYLQTLDDVYENVYNPTKKRKVLIVFDDMIVDMEANKKLIPIVTELFMRGRKLNISLVFISQFYLKVL